MSAEIDQPKNKQIAGFVIATVIGIVAVIVGVQQYFNGVIHAEVTHKVLALPSDMLMALRGEEGRKLEGYRWVDQKKGVVSIPVERARQLYLEDAAKPAPAPEAPPAK